MTTSTILFLILSFGIAVGLSFYQYFFKAGSTSKVNVYLALLRFIAVFGVLLLLINPIISRRTFETIKTPLPVIADNSASIVDLNAADATAAIYKQLLSNSALRQKFDVEPYRFSDVFEATETLDFKGRQTNIDEVAKSLKNIHKNAVFPIVLLTDGNQTQGNDYVFGFGTENKVFPLAVGDTTTYTDLKIARINVNKYAFHKNKFPVEVFLQYAGTKSVNASFKITLGNAVLHTQNVAFSPSKKSAVINVVLPADKVGLQLFRASVASGETEKNTYNNSKRFAVEIIDQKTNVAIISSINHPDLGALKRAIESNGQRKVTIVKPNDIKTLTDFNVLIVYQPNGAEFKRFYELNKTAGINTFTITGPSTEFGFLNQQQNDLSFKMSGQREDYLPQFNAQFNLFALDDIGFEQFSPLQHAFGSVTTNGNVSVLLSSKIRNIDTGAPLLAMAENQGKRAAYLLGENIWKWRLESHVQNKSYEKFDIFIDKIIQYLATSNARKSLVVTHESFYNSGDAIEITAQYFNKNYEFDQKARLSVTVSGADGKPAKKYDMLKGSNAYKVNLDGLAAGKYNFTVKELNSNSVYKGFFEVLDFDIEKQFVNPDLVQLGQLATRTGGKVYYPDQVDALVKMLLDNPDYKAVEKAVVKKTPLIDWVWLLTIIAAALAAEWFVRKYNGML